MNKNKNNSNKNMKRNKKNDEEQEDNDNDNEEDIDDKDDDDWRWWRKKRKCASLPSDLKYSILGQTPIRASSCCRPSRWDPQVCLSLSSCPKVDFWSRSSSPGKGVRDREAAACIRNNRNKKWRCGVNDLRITYESFSSSLKINK